MTKLRRTTAEVLRSLFDSEQGPKISFVAYIHLGLESISENVPKGTENVQRELFLFFKL